MKRFLAVALLLCLALGARAQDAAQDNIERFSSERFPLLEGQVQSLKRDILGFSRDLHALMNEALFPSETQVAVYVSSTAASGAFQINSIQLSLDGRAIANRVYSMPENQALREGGVHRLFLGRIDPGSHQLTVSFLVSEPDGRNRRTDTSFTFRKDATAKVLEIKITGDDGSRPELQFKEWRSS